MGSGREPEVYENDELVADMKQCKYLTMNGWKPGYIVRSFEEYGDTYHEVIGECGEKFTLKNWKVRS